MRRDIACFTLLSVIIFLYTLDTPTYYFSVPNYISFTSLIISILGCVIILLGLFYLFYTPNRKKEKKLLKYGIYQYIRHPIYTGLILSSFFYALYCGSLLRVSLSIVLLGVLYFKTTVEEKTLEKVFSDYKNYKETTGRFFPYFNKKS